MGKIKEYKKVSLFLIIAILLIAFFYVNKSINNDRDTLNKNTILVQIENSYNKTDLDENSINTINKYLENSDQDSKYFFIKGYLNYIEKNYNSALSTKL